jgi:hypothetical protein
MKDIRGRAIEDFGGGIHYHTGLIFPAGVLLTDCQACCGQLPMIEAAVCRLPSDIALILVGVHLSKSDGSLKNRLSNTCKGNGFG